MDNTSAELFKHLDAAVRKIMVDALEGASYFEPWHDFMPEQWREAHRGLEFLGRDNCLTIAALLVEKFGWKVFPARIDADGKKYSWLSKEHAPGHENWGMTDDPEQLKKNFRNRKWRLKCGVGVPTGAGNGI